MCWVGCILVRSWVSCVLSCVYDLCVVVDFVVCCWGVGGLFVVVVGVWC